jgi:dynein heavy chain
MLINPFCSLPKVTVVNCAVTKQGLEAQLLALVMERDCPHVAKRRADLVLQRSHLCIRIGSLEDEILQHLSTCEGDVSADRALIDRLENLKKLSSEAKIQLHDTGSAIIRTQNVCDMYMNVARRGSLLFFLVFDLCELDPHYVCGIGTFIAVFMRGMEPVGESLIPEDEEELERDLPRRVAELKNRVTSSIYSFLERGMTESDKVTVAATLGLRIWESSRLPQGLLRDRQALLTAILGHEESAQNSADEVPGVWGEVMDARRWRALHRLESLSHSFPAFSKIQEKALGDTEAWSAWLQDPLPEIAELPTHLSDLDDVGRLLLVRAMYPERFRASLEHFVRSTLGDSYISHSPTSLASAWVETTSSMPTLLLSCPGSQPTARIEELGAGFGLSGSESTFVQISMGPGEKRRAEVVLRELSASGGWMVLQNVHLVTDWLHSFNEIFEDLSPTFHENFRCFLIAEAQPAVHLPEGLLQKCMKIRLEPPSGLAANLRRSWSFFDQSKLEACSKELQYRACLYGLCCFHAILLGRKRFGSTGWSTPYRFSDGDLLMCANLLQERIECAKKGSVPWRELRYIFGEVVYGGYVRSDIWDQRLALAYLELIFDDEANLLHGKMLAPGLSAPSPEGMDYELYWEHMERNIPQDSPAMFGLPVNAEMGCLVTEGTSMARALSLIYTDKPTSGNKDVELLTVDKYTSTLTSFASEADICGILLPRIPPTFNIQELEAVAERLRYQEHGPYAMCAFQECARMNVLLLGMRKGIEELLKVMRGQILASNSTDTLLESLTAGEVPTVWQNAAWPSSMKLSGWLDSLTQRVSTLRAAWTRRGLRLPYSVWLSGLFNPSAFLLAVKQVHAHRFSIPLECLTISMDVSCLYSADEAETLQLYPEDGAIVHGLFIEGARWKPLQELNDSSARLKKLAETLKVEPQPSLESCAVQPGCLAPSLPQALRSPLPLVFIRATTIQEEWEVLPGPVGCLRWEPDIYDCPVYSTSARGGELVFVAGLPMSEGELVRKWVLAGAAIVLEDL